MCFKDYYYCLIMNRLQRGKLLVKLASTNQSSSQSFLDEVTGVFRPITDSQDSLVESDGSLIDIPTLNSCSSGTEYIPSDSSSHNKDFMISEDDCYHDNLNESTGEITRTYKGNARKRQHCSKGKADSSKWKRQRAQLSKLKGEAYKGFKKEENGKYKQSIIRPPKTLQNGCNGHIQSQPPKERGGPKQKFDCNDLTEGMRRKIFDKYWKIQSWESRKIFVRSLVTSQEPQHRRPSKTGLNSTKMNSYKYFLIFEADNGERKKFYVCKKMFASTLGVGARQLRIWIRNNQITGESEPNQSEPNLPTSNQLNSITEFLDRLPKMESHYCRASSKKQYLESTWNSVTGDLFEEYLNFCSLYNKTAHCKSLFAKTFRNLNYDIFKPRKDQCNKCLAFKNNNLSQQEYDVHQERKVKSREEKTKDKEQSDDQTLVFTMDVQAVMLCPRIQASATYYKTKLKVHNSTHYNLKTGAAVCFLWHEENGGLESDVFASILIKHLTQQTRLFNPAKIIIWSDGCCYQNRSVVLSNCLLEFAVKENLIIEQKYLEVGHTQMEVDTMHSAIERKLPAHREIYIPADYIGVIKSARKIPEPYQVVFLNYKDFTKHSGGRYSSIRPGNKKGDPCVTDICAIQYLSDGKIKYKLHFHQEYEYLPRRPKESPVTTDLLYAGPLAIDITKYQHLQEMKHLMPQDYHPFYNNLEHGCDEEICPHRRSV